MRVIVTGGSGRAGRHTVQELANGGHEVRLRSALHAHLLLFRSLASLSRSTSLMPVRFTMLLPRCGPRVSVIWLPTLRPVAIPARAHLRTMCSAPIM